MFLWTTKSGCWKRSAIPSITLSNALKYRTDTIFLLIGVNVTEIHHPCVLLIDIPRETSIHPYLSIFVKPSSTFPQNPTESFTFNKEFAAF